MPTWDWKTAIGNLAGYATVGFGGYLVLGAIGIVVVMLLPVLVSIAIGIGIVLALNWILKKVLGL